MEAEKKKNRFEMDMCSGPLMGKLISFAVPLMLSSNLQLLFNAVDIIVVGKYSGSHSLAAVGATTSLMNLLITLLIGISLGTNVLAGRYYAAHDEQQMQAVVHTSMAFALKAGRQSNAEQRPQVFGLDLHSGKLQLIAAVGFQKTSDHKDAGYDLGDHRGNGHTQNTHVEHNDQNHIEACV